MFYELIHAAVLRGAHMCGVTLPPVGTRSPTHPRPIGVAWTLKSSEGTLLLLFLPGQGGTASRGTEGDLPNGWFILGPRGPV